MARGRKRCSASAYRVIPSAIWLVAYSFVVKEVGWEEEEEAQPIRDADNSTENRTSSSSSQWDTMMGNLQ